MNREESLKEMMKKDEESGIYKKLTAVEWLADQIQEQLDIFCPGGILCSVMIEQAKAMEKERIIEAHKQASIESGFEDSAEDWANEYWDRNYGV